MMPGFLKNLRHITGSNSGSKVGKEYFELMEAAYYARDTAYHENVR